MIDGREPHCDLGPRLACSYGLPLRSQSRRPVSWLVVRPQWNSEPDIGAVRYARRCPQSPAGVSMIDRQMASPMPRPSRFVVKKGWNMRSATAGSSPVPTSLTATSTLLGSESIEETVSSLARSVTSFMASTPFMIRFKHLLQLTRSPMTAVARASSVRSTTSWRSSSPRAIASTSLDDVVDVELGQLRPGFPGQRPQTADHLARAHAIPPDRGKRIPHFVKIGFSRVQEPQSGLALGHDGGEWLVDLMSD